MARPRTIRRSTIGADPFDAVIPAYPPAKFEPALPPAPEPPQPPPLAAVAPAPVLPPAEPEAVAAAEPLEGRQKLTVHLDADVVNRVKNAAYWNPRLTIAKIAERGIRLALKEVEREHGGQYPQREGALVGGRPIK